MKKSNTFNKLLYGLLPGLILPTVTSLVSAMVIYKGSVQDSLHYFSYIHKLPNLMSLSAIPNLLLFFLFIWTEKYRSARGVILATFLIVFVVLIMKFL